jgi:hypothetical protein
MYKKHCKHIYTFFSFMNRPARLKKVIDITVISMKSAKRMTGKKLMFKMRWKKTNTLLMVQTR